MRYRGVIVLFFLSSLLLTKCNVNKSDVRHYVDNFYLNKERFEELITELRSSKSFHNETAQLININELNKETTQKINQLGIVDVEISYSQCKGVTHISLTTSWTKKATVYFTKDSCDKIQTVKGYHDKKSEMIEVWGLGDNWLMWIDYDFI